MARYLIRLGRETGQGRHWTAALAMLDSHPRPALSARPDRSALGGPRNRIGPPGREPWRNRLGLHAMLIDTMLDFAGLDYDAVDRRLDLGPVLPGSLAPDRPQAILPLRRVAYRLERPIGGKVHT